ncbi:MAG: hypothetical protein AAB778_01870 [Patescibacteria group bacterium]
MRKTTDLAVISNLFFMIPLLLAISQSNIYHIALISILILSSFLYHFYKELKFFIFDLVCAILLISYNFYSFYLFGYYSINFLVALLFVGVGFIFYFKSLHKNYSFNHAIWHLCSSIITILAVLSVKGI